MISKSHSVRVCCSFIALVGFLGCGENTDDTPPVDEKVCELPALRVGDEKAGENGLGVELLEFEPEPPQRFDNRWVVELQKDAKPVEGGSMKVTPFMPLHQHGASEPVVVTELEPAKFELEPINMWMPGLWEVRFALSAEGVKDNVVFEVCIDE